MRGENPTVLRRLPSGFAVIGDTQFLPGYCVLLAAPEVAHLDEMPRPARVQFLDDLALLGATVRQVCQRDGCVRVNYSILGNGLPIVHGHVFPRYDWEPDERRRGPVWLYPNEQLYGEEHELGPRHDGLRDRLRSTIEQLVSART